MSYLMARAALLLLLKSLIQNLNFLTWLMINLTWRGENRYLNQIFKQQIQQNFWFCTMEKWGRKYRTTFFLWGECKTLPSSASTQLNSILTKTKAEVILIFSFRQATHPPVEVVGRCNPSPVNPVNMFQNK